MAINVECESCFHTFRVAEKFVGRRGKCPVCGSGVQVPSTSAVDRQPPPRARPNRATGSAKKKSGESPQSLNLFVGIGGVAVVAAALAGLYLRGPGDIQRAGNAPQAAGSDQATSAGETTDDVSVADTALAASSGTAVDRPEIPSTRGPAPDVASNSSSAGVKTPVAMVTAAPSTNTVGVVQASESSDLSSAQALPASAPMTTAEVVRRVEPSIVRINALSEQDELEWHGSGFVIDDSGVVVTNHQVVFGAHKCVAVFASGVKCDVKGYYVVDEERDIALLQIDVSEGDHPALPLSQLPPDKDEQVLAFGCPRGLDFSTTDGLISAIRSADDLQSMLGADVEGEWLETSALVSPGSSGGPLVNLLGEVVGLSSYVLAEDQNLNVAITAAEVRALFDRRGDSLTTLSRRSKDQDGTIDVVGSRFADKCLSDTVVTSISYGVHGIQDGTLADFVKAHVKQCLRSSGISVSEYPPPSAPSFHFQMSIRDGEETGTFDISIKAYVLAWIVIEDKQRPLIVLERHGDVASPKKYKYRKDYRAELQDGLTSFFATVESEIHAAKQRRAEW